MGALTADVLHVDAAAETARVADRIRHALRDLGRRGCIVAVSGGVDSAVSATLAVRAVGAARVFCVMMPERDSSPSSIARARELTRWLGVDAEERDLSPVLAALGAYAERDAAVRTLFPDYGTGWRFKIAIRGGLEGRYNSFDLVVQRPGARHVERRPLPADAFFRIVAATNYKQRARKTIEYFHADRLHYAVVGTPNRLEYDQGFFVKLGDGAADIKPIAHLYKTQVYALAEHLGVPASIRTASPTTDTYSLEQGQDEFYFALSYGDMDRALWAHNHGVPAHELAETIGVPVDRAQWIYQDIDAKRHATRYLHARARLAAPVDEVAG